MALLTIDEFAEKCKMTRRMLMVYVNPTRGKVVVEYDKDKKGLVDSLHEKNIAFYNKWEPKNTIAKENGKEKKARNIDKGKTEEQIPREETFIEPVSFVPRDFKIRAANGDENDIDNDLGTDDNDILDYHESEKKKKHYDAIVSQRNSEKLKLEIEKKKGEVVPVSPIENLVFQFKQHVLTQGKIAYQAFLNEIGHKYSITAPDMAYYRGYFIKALNNSANEATEAFVRDLERVLNEFAVKKGVGQKN